MQTVVKSRACVAVITLLLGISVADGKYAGGTGEPNNPYQIATAADLMALGESPGDYDKHFVQTADIDLDPGLPGRKVFTRAVIAPDAGGELWWEFYGTPFTGTFDGRGYTISHLTIVGKGFLGLFGKSGPGATISNVGLHTVAVNGTGAIVGGLAGRNSGTITGCYSFGAITGGEYCVGGLVGENDGSIAASQTDGVVKGQHNVGGLVGENGFLTSIPSIATSHSTGAVNGTRGVGGLVGLAYGRITRCYSTGAVRGLGTVGGLLGAGEDMESITQCYSTGAVSGDEWSIGGLVGYIDCGNVTQCYSIGAVRGGERVGGLVGYIEAGNLIQCYSASVVGGRSDVGPLVGVGDSVDVTACLWDAQVCGLTTPYGGTGKTTAEMQTAATFLATGWDLVGETANGSEDIWQLDEASDHSDYPHLWRVAAED